MWQATEEIILPSEDLPEKCSSAAQLIGITKIKWSIFN